MKRKEMRQCIKEMCLNISDRFISSRHFTHYVNTMWWLWNPLRFIALRRIVFTPIKETQEATARVLKSSVDKNHEKP